MKVKAIWFASLAHLWLGASVALYGQNIRGSMVGNVTDSSGAAVPGALRARRAGRGARLRAGPRLQRLRRAR